MRLALPDAALAALLLPFSAASVWTTIQLCRKQGWVARPRSDRWHRSTPSLFGGVPIFLTCITASFLFLPLSEPKLRQLLASSCFIFILGLADDILRLRPLAKLAGQTVAALFVVSSGFVYPLHQNATVNFVISVVWIVGITNAFNLLDNMDGLAAGVAVISAIYLAIFYGGTGSFDYQRMALFAAAAAGGFFIFNFYPALIFMGDCGSLFLGFLLGALCMPRITHVSGLPTLVLAPCAVLAIPVFDTAFVSVTRRLRGQPISQGGTDHSSHRLVQLGLSESNAVLLLLFLSVVSGAVATVARHIVYPHAIALMALWFVALLLFGIFLSRSDSIAARLKAKRLSAFPNPRLWGTIPSAILNSPTSDPCASEEGESLSTLHL